MVEGGEGSTLLLEPLPDCLCSIVDNCSATHSLLFHFFFQTE